MARKKRRSSKFKDSSTVIDIEEARQERQERQEERRRKRQEAAGKGNGKKLSRSGASRSAMSARASSVTAAASGLAASARAAAGQAFGPEPEPEGPSGVRSEHRRMALRRRKQYRNLIILGVLAVLLVLVGFSVGNILMLKHDLHNAQKQQEAYKEEKEQLEQDLQDIDDLQNLEQQARNQMRLIKPGETLYIFPEDMTRQQEYGTEETD